MRKKSAIFYVRRAIEPTDEQDAALRWLEVVGKRYVQENERATEVIDQARWQVGDAINASVAAGIPKRFAYRITCDAAGFSQRYAYEMARMSAKFGVEERASAPWRELRKVLVPERRFGSVTTRGRKEVAEW